jgi:hypothetical protein
MAMISSMRSSGSTGTSLLSFDQLTYIMRRSTGLPLNQ